MKENQDKNVDSAIAKVSEIVSKLAGIQLGPRQAPMVESRLRIRMVKLKIESFEGYLRYLDQNFEKRVKHFSL